MENRLRPVMTLALAAGSAALAAFALGQVAHDDLGLSRMEIRYSALIATALIAMCLATGLFRRNSHK
jgi:hypothetical protein